MVHDAVFYDLHLGSGYTFISIGKWLICVMINDKFIKHQFVFLVLCNWMKSFSGCASCDFMGGMEGKGAWFIFWFKYFIKD